MTESTFYTNESRVTIKSSRAKLLLEKRNEHFGFIWLEIGVRALWYKLKQMECYVTKSLLVKILVKITFNINYLTIFLCLSSLSKQISLNAELGIP